MNSKAKVPRRRFAVLDREKAVRSATGALRSLRTLQTFAKTHAQWQCGLGYALDVLERQLADTLLFSADKRLVVAGETSAAITDLTEARRMAADVVKVLQKILKDARSDLSVSVHQCDELDSDIDLVEQKLNDLLPPPGAPPRARLPFDDDDEEDDGAGKAQLPPDGFDQPQA